MRNAEHYGDLLKRAEATRLTGMRYISLRQHMPQHDHIDCAMALESARADIITQARRSDELVAAGVADTGATDDAVDWDTAASFQQPAAPTPTT